MVCCPLPSNAGHLSLSHPSITAFDAGGLAGQVQLQGPTHHAPSPGLVHLPHAQPPTVAAQPHTQPALQPILAQQPQQAQQPILQQGMPILQQSILHGYKGSALQSRCNGAAAASGTMHPSLAHGTHLAPSAMQLHAMLPPPANAMAAAVAPSPLRSPRSAGGTPSSMQLRSGKAKLCYQQTCCKVSCALLTHTHAQARRWKRLPCNGWTSATWHRLWKQV